ncbi:hypothetical protein [Streptomyces sp. URMC 123]|uniref:hypothetical protein n=1 Tax=Streptomyces sp. URMC 123 TaxID=3423403 RepID=UPI003F1CCE59
MSQHADAPFRPDRVTSRLPVARRAGSSGIERDCNRWARPHLISYFGGPGAERAPHGYLRRRKPLWACVCYPHMLADRTFALPNLMIPCSIAEEVLARSAPEAHAVLRDRFLAVLAGAEARPGFPAGRMLQAALALAVPQMATGVAERALGAFRVVLARRTPRAFALWATVQTEYALGIDLSGELATEPALRHARDLAVDHLALVGELRALPAPRTRDARTADRLGRAVVDTEDRFTESCGEVLCGPLGSHPGIRRYVPELGHLISGNLHFHRLAGLHG